MQEQATPAQLVKAQIVYDYLIQQPIGVLVPSTVVAYDCGLEHYEVGVGFHWALREICPKTGIYLGSKKGPYGGYFVTDQKADAADDEERWLGETWTHLQKNRSKTLTRKKGKLGSRTTLREVDDALASAINTVENALAKHGRVVGHVAADEKAST